MEVVKPGQPREVGVYAGASIDLDAVLRAHHRAVVSSSGADLSTVHGVAASIFECLRKEALTAHAARHWVLRHKSVPEAIGHTLAGKVCDGGGCFAGSSAVELNALAAAYTPMFVEVLSRPSVLSSVLADVAKAWLTDPAVTGLVQSIFFFKGFQALAMHRVAHALWVDGGPTGTVAALLLQSRGSELFSVDIHPGATIGGGVMLDHASGVVIGATAVVGSDVYMLHGVTLGATGKPMGDARRHPWIGASTIIGAGSTLLGGISVGERSTIGAAAVVTRDCPEGGTMIGVNNLLKRRAKAPGLPTGGGSVARPPSSLEPQLSLRGQFERRMSQQQEASRVAAPAATPTAASTKVSSSSAKGGESARSGRQKAYLSLSVVGGGTKGKVTAATAAAGGTSSSTGGGAPQGTKIAAALPAMLEAEEGTYDFYGESDTWMYDRKAIELVALDPEPDEDEPVYDMFL
jgi:serine O-acetyltransferase